MFGKRKILLEVATASLIGLAVLLAVPVLDGFVRDRIDQGLSRARLSLSRSTGLVVSFQSLSPSLLQRIELSGLSAADENGRRLVQSDKVRVYYDLAALVLGKSDFLTEIRIDDADIRFDAVADKATLDKLGSYLYTGNGGAIPRIVVSGSNTKIAIASPDFGLVTFSARGFRFAAEDAEARLSLSGAFAVRLPASSRTIEGPIQLSGSLSRNFERAKLELAMAARSSDFVLETQRFDLALSDGMVELRKIKDRAPLDALARYDLKDKSLDLQLKFDGYRPASSLKAKNGLAALSPWFANPYSGRLSFSMPRGDPKLIRYEGSVETALPQSLGQKALMAALDFSGDASWLSIARASLSTEQGRAEYQGSLRLADLSPQGRLSLELSLAGGRVPLSALLVLGGEGGAYECRAERFAIAGLPFRELSISAKRRGQQLDFRALCMPPAVYARSDPEIPPEPGAAAPEQSRITAEGNLSFGTKPGLDAALIIESLDARPMKTLFEALLKPTAASLLAGLRLDGSVFVTSDFKRLSWSSSDLDLRFYDLPRASALLSLSGTLDSVVARRFVLSFSGASIEGEGRADFAPGRRVGFESRLRFQDLPFGFRGSYSPEGLFISGDYGFALELRSMDEAFRGMAVLNALPLPVGGGIILASLDLSGRFNKADDWSLVLSSLSLAPAGESFARLPALALSGVFGPGSGSLSMIDIRDKVSRLAGSANFEYGAADDGGLRIDASARIGLPGSLDAQTERYEITASADRSRIEARVGFAHSPLERLGIAFLAGGLDGELLLSGSAREPVFKFSAALDQASYRKQPLALSLKGEFDGRTLRLDEAQGLYFDHAILSAAGYFSLDDASAGLKIDYSIGRVESHKLSFDLELSGRSGIVDTGASRAFADTASPTSSVAAPIAAPLAASPDAKRRSLKELVSDYELLAALRDIKIADSSVAYWPFEARVRDGGFTLRGGENNELSILYSADGEFEGHGVAPFPIAFDAQGHIRDDEIQASARNLDFDMSLFGLFVRQADLVFLRGRGSGELRFSGLFADPEIEGELLVSDCLLKVPGWVGDPIGPFTVPIMAEGRSLSLFAPSVAIGDARAIVEGQAQIDHWLPAGFSASVRTINGTLVQVATAVLGVDVQGSSTLDLSFALDKAGPLRINGTMNLGKAVIVVGPDVGVEKKPLPEKPVILDLDLAIGIGKGVQVIFPSKDFPIVSGYAESDSSLAIRYDQNVEDLSMTGAIALRGGDVFYVQRDFFLKKARIVFNETIAKFDPRVTLRAELREMNDKGPVTISLSVDDASILNFNPHLSSSPPMSESQIASLLGAKLLGMEKQGNLELKNVVLTGAEFIPKFNAVKSFERRVRDALGLDILFFKTQIVQRWLLDFSFQDSAPGAMLGRYLDQTALYMGKYVGDSIFIHAAARVQQDPLAAGVPLRLNSELGIEFTTPFGLIMQWTIEPSDLSSLFISDQSIGLSWKFSY